MYSVGAADKVGLGGEPQTRVPGVGMSLQDSMPSRSKEENIKIINK